MYIVVMDIGVKPFVIFIKHIFFCIVFDVSSMSLQMFENYFLIPK